MTLNEAENQRIPLDKGELKKFARKAQAKLSRAFSHAESNTNVIVNRKFVVRVKRTIDEIRLACNELEEGLVSQEQLGTICTRIDEAVRRYDGEAEFDSGLAQLFDKIKAILSDLRNDFSETFEVKTGAEIETEAKQEKTKTFVQFMEEDMEVSARAISTCISQTTGRQAKEFATYFVNSLARDNRLNFAERISQRDLETIVSIFDKLEQHAVIACDRALANSVSFQEFWKKYSEELREFETGNAQIDKHFQKEVIRVFCEQVETTEDLEYLIQSEDRLAEYDQKTVLEAICPDRLLALEEDEFEIDIPEAEALKIIELARALNGNATEDPYEQIADTINFTWHADLDIRSAEDIKAIIEESGVDTVSIQEMKPDSAPEEESGGPESLQSKTEGESAPELVIIQESIERTADDLQKKADYYRISSTLLRMQRSLVKEALKYYEMRQPEPEKISSIEGSVERIGVELAPYIAELSNGIIRLSNSRVAIHKAISIIESGKHAADTQQQQRAELESFLALFADCETKLEHVRALVKELKELKERNTEIADTVSRGNRFVEKELRMRFRGIDPKDLFMTGDQYLLTPDEQNGSRLEHIDQAIHRYEISLEEIEELTEDLPTDYRVRAQETLQKLELRQNQGQTEENKENTERKDEESDQKMSSLKEEKIEVPVGKSELIEKPGEMPRCRMEFDGEILEFGMPALCAARILEVMGEYNRHYHFILRDPHALAVYVAEIFDDFQGFRGDYKAISRLAKLIEDDMTSISGKVNGTNKISREMREETKRPVIQGIKKLRAKAAPAFVGSPTLSCFLENTPIKTCLTEKQRLRLCIGIETRKNKNAEMKAAQKKKKKG